MTYLPVNKQDMLQCGWNELDFLIISGDAYVDHPSFAPALLGRLLEDAGYRTGIIAQPSLSDPDSLLSMGRPRLAVLIAPGAVDSMVNNYTAARRPRSDDRYSPGGRGGKRPDRAVIRYCNLVRAQMGDIPLVIGGIESSLRRFAHYDYWSNKVRRTILQDSQADILVFGMGEKPLLELAELLAKGVPVRRINALRGTCVLMPPEDLPGNCASFIARFNHQTFSDRKHQGGDPDSWLCRDEHYKLLPSFEEVTRDKLAYALATKHIYQEQDPTCGLGLLQQHGRRYLLQNPPLKPLAEAEMDRIYSLPFTRQAHPMYDKQGKIPALEEVSFSITAHRGCFGGCNFCAITMHQGRIIQNRSRESILREVKELTGRSDFKGYIHDIGGPTANFYRPACKKQKQGKVCQDRQCMYPQPCKALDCDHSEWLETLRQARRQDGVRKIFIRSGIRYDYLLLADDKQILDELCRHHVSGQLKVAPEHVSLRVLQAMGKPPADEYFQFKDEFTRQNEQLGQKQYLVPYWLSGHPGSTLDDAIELALYIKSGGIVPEQVQDFYPTPGTISTAMYYTGINPLDLAPVHVPDDREKAMQRALLQYNRPENRKLVLQALRLAGRTDLIGSGPGVLIAQKYDRQHKDTKNNSGKNTKQKSLKPKEDFKHAHNYQRQRAGSKAASGTGGKNRRPGKARRQTGPGSYPGR